MRAVTSTKPLDKGVTRWISESVRSGEIVNVPRLLPKPFEYELLLKQLRQLIGRRAGA